nr:thioredoxin [Oscillospiraceae bacterium]
DSMIGSAIIKFVDVDKSGNLAAEYPVRVIPTQVFFLADGTPYVPSEEIDVEFLAYSDKTTGERLFTVHEGALTEEELNAILADMGVTQ